MGSISELKKISSGFLAIKKAHIDSFSRVLLALFSESFIIIGLVSFKRVRPY